MTKQDWDKCFVWLAAMFPQWKVTVATSAVWYDELGIEITPREFQQGVRVEMQKNPSPFPPGVFEIRAAVLASKPAPRPLQLEAKPLTPEQWERNRLEAKRVLEAITKKVGEM